MLDTVVVTGGLGGAGSWIVDSLRTEYDVVSLDLELKTDLEIDGASFQAVDLTERAHAWETIVDAEPSAVVHFGNIPHEEHHASGDVYENNTLSTFHVLEAAGRAGARIVWASSETVYGTHWPEPKLPKYLPIDEEHPVKPWNVYETSKLAGEAVADRVAAVYDVPVASIRPSWIQYPGRYQITPIRKEFSLHETTASGNMWSYVDVRDVVGIVESALEADFEGHEVFNAFASDNYLDVATADAVAAGYGELPEQCSLDGDESAFSTAKATEILGWRPEHSWKDAEGERVDGPSFV